MGFIRLLMGLAVEEGRKEGGMERMSVAGFLLLHRWGRRGRRRRRIVKALSIWGIPEGAGY